MARQAGAEDARALGGWWSRRFVIERDREGRGVTHKALPTDRDPKRARAFVDCQNDVTTKEIRLAVREGHAPHRARQAPAWRPTRARWRT
jgi:sarcosine oxidase, subunit alpha